MKKTLGLHGRAAIEIYKKSGSGRIVLGGDQAVEYT
jgi:hypothetical protein